MNPTNLHREQAREIVSGWFARVDGSVYETAILTDCIAFALSSRDVQIERMIAAHTHFRGVIVPRKMASRDTEIREVLEGLANHQIGTRRPCWCPPAFESEPHTPACLTTSALYMKVQPREGIDVSD